MSEMNNSIILIGPIRTGKTTLAKQLSKDLGWTNVSLDELRWKYYAEIGFDRESEEQMDLNTWRLYKAKHDPYAIERILEDYPNKCVIDFGGSHSLHEDESSLKKVKKPLRTISFCHFSLASSRQRSFFTNSE